MANPVKIGSISDITSGSMKTVTVAGKAIALARIGDEFFAVDDRCSHEECSLGTEGMLDDNVIICGCHGAQFDVTTGSVLALPATRDITSYKVTVEGTDVFLQMP
jgi:nitrite reductase/ring-hydroxylating ferredoxin subunit